MFFDYFIYSRILPIAYLKLAILVQLGISVCCYFSVRSPVFGQVALVVLDYRWSHNPTIYRRAVTRSWYRTHTVLNFAPKLALLQEHATTSDFVIFQGNMEEYYQIWAVDA